MSISGLPNEVQKRINRIGLDSSRGSVELTTSAAETLMDVAELADASSANELTAYVASAGRALVDTQPMMASIFNLTNSTLLNIEGLDELAEIRKAIRESCRKYISYMENAREEAENVAKDLIQDGTVIMTHSYSSTVLNALKLAKGSEKQFNVICTESRLKREGLALAKDLGQEGISASLIIDAAMFSLLPKTQLVLIGANIVTPEGLVNKVGSLGLALAAKAFRIEFYAVCSTEKFLPASRELQAQRLRDPDEILPNSMNNVTAINYYFDVTARQYLTGIVTEKGIVTPEQLERHYEYFQENYLSTLM